MRLGFVVALSLALAAGVGALAAETDGFQIVTSEGARRLAIERTPRPIGDVALIDQDGATFSFADYRGETVLVEFIYTGCPTLCTVLGAGFGDIEEAARREAGKKFALLSISFDRANDRVSDLKSYGQRYGATKPGWRIAMPLSAAGLRYLKRVFGLVVIPDGYGGFIHNGAVYVVDPRSRLVRILDPGEAGRAARRAVAAATP
jgi:protein SCO1/2